VVDGRIRIRLCSCFQWHYLFEKNHPATFKYPISGFAVDWVMWKDILNWKDTVLAAARL